MAHLFPHFKNDRDYQRAIVDFNLRYRKIYKNNNMEPEYTVQMKDFESTFLVFLPLDKEAYARPKCLHPIIYVEKMPSRDGVSLVEYSYFLFEPTSDSVKEKMSQHTEGQISYEQLMDIQRKEISLHTQEKFDIFNEDCVFQLQPEHYHYFASYFKDFEPFVRKMMAYDAQRFKSSVVPKSLL